MLLVELNEFNKDLLKSAAESLKLKNIQKILALTEFHTITDDTYDSGYLEPWVQWVSVHTGTPSAKHQIKHLGDVPNVTEPQIWERLSEKGVTCGVWGAMNASRNAARNCLFFLPDPWTFTELGYPEPLNQLLDLPRYISKNYLNLSGPKVAAKFLHFLKAFATPKTVVSFLKELPRFLKNVVKYKGEHFVFICLTDFLLTDLFLEYRKKYKPEFSIIFLNGLAHLQHHHWVNADFKKSPRLVFGLKSIDRLLGNILAELPADEPFLFFNGLSQKNTNSEKPWVLYRQFDQMAFLKTVGVEVDRVEPHMTHDAHLFFKNEANCKTASNILRSAIVESKPLFLVETYNDNLKKLFYRIDFTGEVSKDTEFTIGATRFKFSDLFESIVVRTGKHIPNGTIFSNLKNLPTTFYNHELSSHILNFYKEKKHENQ